MVCFTRGTVVLTFAASMVAPAEPCVKYAPYKHSHRQLLMQVSPAEFAPAGWDGRVLLLFVMKDGAPGTKVQAYVTAQPPPV